MPDHRFGLVRQASAWIVWVQDHGHWRAAGGDDDKLIAQQLARELGGRLRKRGEHPADGGKHGPRRAG